MKTNTQRIYNLLDVALGNNEWELGVSENGEDHWLEPIYLAVQWQHPYSVRGYGLCDAQANTPEKQAAFLIEQALGAIYADTYHNEAAAELAVTYAQEELYGPQ